MNFYALGLFQSIRSHSCCALHASKYAQSHSSCYWAAVRRATYWPTLSSNGQFIIPLRLGVEMWFRFRFKIHFITAVVLCLGGGIGEISSLVSLFYVNAMYICSV